MPQTPMANYIQPQAMAGGGMRPMPPVGAPQQQPGIGQAMQGMNPQLMALLAALKQGQSGVPAPGQAIGPGGAGTPAQGGMPAQMGPSANQVGQIAQGMNPQTMAAQLASNQPIGQVGSPTGMGQMAGPLAPVTGMGSAPLGGNYMALMNMLHGGANIPPIMPPDGGFGGGFGGG